MRDGLLMAAGYVSAPWLKAAAQQSGAPSAPDHEHEWRFGNEWIERTLVFADETGLTTKAIESKQMGATLLSPAVSSRSKPQEFSFLCNGQLCAGNNGVFAERDYRKGPPACKDETREELRHKTLPLDVSVVYRVYDGHPAIRKHLELRNTGTEPLRISHMNIESLWISLGPADEITLLTQYGTVPREIFYTGRSEDAGLLIANGKTGEGIAVISEVPGYMKRTEVGGWDAGDATRIGVMYDTDLMPFERTLAPGEMFATASSSLVAFKAGDGFNDPHWVLPSYAAKVLERRVDAKGAPWIYNTWEPFERGIDHDTVMQSIEAASAMGIDIFTIDDGWQQEYGANTVDPKAFPNGLRPIMDALDTKGMRLGLWIPMAAIGKSTSEYTEHPEWASRDREGNIKTTGTMAGEKVVMCLASGYSDVAAERINDAIDRFKLAYVKLDLTTIFNAYGEAPGCSAKGHYHPTWAESLIRIYEGISHTTAKVYAKHPDVLLDLTFELWGQKHILDAGLLAAGDLDWMSNVDDRVPHAAGPRQARQLLYSHAATMPAEAMLIGNIHAELPTIEESFATAIGSAPLLLGDLRKLTASDRAWYGERIGWFKEFRRRHRISESFFPLGSWRQTSPGEWDGFARFARTGNGVIALFRNERDAADAMVKLPLLPAGSYKLRSVITGREWDTATHADFARGLAIEFPGKVEVLEVTCAEKG